MKIKLEIVDNDLNPILTKYISEETYKLSKEYPPTDGNFLENLTDKMLLDIKWELSKLKW